MLKKENNFISRNLNENIIKEDKMVKKEVVFVIMFIILASSVSAADYYVAKDGSGDYSSIQAAADIAQGGDTIYVRAGTYNERVTPKNSGSPDNYITYTAYPEEEVIINGDGISIGWWNGLFDIDQKSYIKVSGFRIEDSRYNGIRIKESDNIIIEKNHMYHTYSCGIEVQYSSNIIIDNNEVELAHSWNTPYSGSDEAISIVVTDTFEVKNNYVHDCNKEGIDVKVSSSNGKVYNNHVHDTQAVGIYIDGGYYTEYGYPGTDQFSIDVYQNIVHETGGGIIVANEGGGGSEDIHIYNNLVYNCRGAGLELFQYPGTVKGVRFVNNVVYNNNDGIFFLDPEAEDCVIRNNIFSNNNNNAIITNYGGSTGRVTVDHNLIDGSTQINGDDPVIGNPNFVNPSNRDFHLQSSSPAIDQGSPVDIPTVDFDGVPRPQGSGWDIGAYEYGGAPPQSCTDQGYYCCPSGYTCSSPRSGSGCSGQCCASQSACTQAPDCGDGTCDSGETCSSCPADCPTGSGEVCCSGLIYTGDCCSPSDCNTGYYCNPNHVCTEESQGTEIIIDNLDSGFASTGRWWVSGYPNPYGTNSVASDVNEGSTAMWTPSISQAGNYEAYAWWTAEDGRINDAKYTINYVGGSDLIVVDQKVNGGQWNYLGTYNFNSGTSGSVSISDESTDPNYVPGSISDSVCADAVRFVKTGGSACGDADSDSDGVIDITELISYIGEWKVGNATISDLIEAIGKWKSGC